MQYRAIASVEGSRSTSRATPLGRASESASAFSCCTTRGDCAAFAPRRSMRCRAGEATSEELATRAFAHLESCAHCRAEHKTNARRLRRSFQGQAARAAAARARRPPRLALARAQGCCCTASCRTAAARAGRRARTRGRRSLAGGGAAAKIAAGAATVAVLAGGTIATHVLEHGPAARAQHSLSRRARHRRDRPRTTPLVPARSSAGRSQAPRHERRARHPRSRRRRRAAPARPGPRERPSSESSQAGSANLEASPTSASPRQRRPPPAASARRPKRTRQARAAEGRSAHDAMKFVGRFAAAHVH